MTDSGPRHPDRPENTRPPQGLDRIVRRGRPDWSGKPGKGVPIPTSFTNQVVRGRILDGNGSGYLADSETDPDRMRWELVDGTLTVLND